MDDEAKARVEEELDELRERMNKLYKFAYSDKIHKLSWNAAGLLQAQIYIMDAYADILIARLNCWNK